MDMQKLYKEVNQVSAELAVVNECVNRLHALNSKEEWTDQEQMEADSHRETLRKAWAKIHSLTAQEPV